MYRTGDDTVVTYAYKPYLLNGIAGHYELYEGSAVGLSSMYRTPVNLVGIYCGSCLNILLDTLRLSITKPPYAVRHGLFYLCILAIGAVLVPCYLAGLEKVCFVFPRVPCYWCNTFVDREGNFLMSYSHNKALERIAIAPAH